MRAAPRSKNSAATDGGTKGLVKPTDLSPTFSSWSPWRTERKTGDWQRSINVSDRNALTFSALFSCVTLIAGDIAKLRVRLVEEDSNGIRVPIHNNAFSPVLRKPNRYQTWLQFMEQWVISKLTHGNTYVLKIRDDRNVVVALYVLDPRRVQPLCAPGAAVFYRIQAENITPIEEAVTVPGSEIIHDRYSPIYGHGLIGVSPISACALAAGQGLEIQEQQTQFFKNGGRPGGIISHPKQISEAVAKRLESTFEKNYGGENAGRILVLGDGMQFEHSTYKPVDVQLVEQLKYSAEMVCTAFHVPAYKVGVGEMPTYEYGSILNQIYYTDCLQLHIETIEGLLREGLRLPPRMHVEFMIEDLLRMDAVSQIQVLKEAVGAGIMSPNEARRRLNLLPVDGGEDPFLQQQNWSLADLAERRNLMDLITSPNPNETDGKDIAAAISVAQAPTPEPVDLDAEKKLSNDELMMIYRSEACPTLS